MQSLKNNLLVICLIVIVILLAADSCKQRRAVSSSVQAVTQKDSIITRWKDKAGREGVKAKERAYTLAQLKNSHSDEVTGLKKEIGRLNQRLRSHTVVKIHTTDTIKTVLRDTTIKFKTDTMEGTTDTFLIVRRFDYRDEWINMEGVILSDSLIASYTLKNDLSITHYFGDWKKNDNNLYLTVKNNNPNTTTTQIQTFKIRERKRHPLVPLFAGLVAGGVTGWLIAKQ